MMAASASPEIQELVDNPVEALHVELKAWLDLSDRETRAKTARHLAALANYGGGYLVIGVRDDLQLDEAGHPGNLAAFSADQFGGIIDRYLTPAFQCDVAAVTPAVGGRPCIVVRIPSHGSVPVCAKANGPENGKGNLVGVRQGEHYIRVPGPKSVAIDSAEQWQPLIRRCVMNDHQSLLESFGRLLHPVEPAKPAATFSLREWHDACRKQYEDAL
jgi:predicted HTH transcriptional regulator